MTDDTIYAVSSGIGRAAVAVVRVSGSEVDEVLRRLCNTTYFVARRATLKRIFDQHGMLLDKGIVVKFDAPKSYTGEPMVEFHITGGRAVTRGILDALAVCPGVRPADAGEFARRAFDNGKIDLTEVEGLIGVVEAETRAQLRHAQTLATGELRRRSEGAKSCVIRALAFAEASLDFADEEDVGSLDPEISEILASDAAQALGELRPLLEASLISERLRDGMRVVIAGPPNAGKSTLLNCIAKRDVAIVSPQAGTTRDALDVMLEVNGFPVILTDTAGIRGTDDEAELAGIQRTRMRVSEADLVLWLNDGSTSKVDPEESIAKVLRVRTKADLYPGTAVGDGEILISAISGSGVDVLVSKLAEIAEGYFAGVGDVSAVTERQQHVISAAVSALERVVSDPARSVELLAEDLRNGLASLGRLTGRVDIEEVLGEIFARLCIGK